MTENTLPPLPIRHTWDIDYESRKPYDLFTADQLRAYAAQAVAQERERVAASPQPAPGMAVQALAAEIVKALLADEEDGGYDLTAGLFGPNFSGLVRRWAALEYAAPQPPSAWRPIEEAPRDGTWVLLWESYDAEPFIGRWNDRRNRWVASTTYYNTDGNACVVDTVCSEAVTHYQPLPPPPSAGEEPS